MAVGFGLVSVVAVAMCGVLISLLAGVSGLVDDMHQDDAAGKDALALATSIREQYIHQAHWIIERDDEHLHHYADWLEQINDRVVALRPRLPKQAATLDGIARDSEELDRLFQEELRPAVLRGAADKVVRLHAQADSLSRQATEAADSVARSVDARMAKAHESATRATTVGLAAGGLCVALILALSVFFTFKLRRSVVQPLQVLASAARDFGEGDFKSRVGKVGEGELLAVAMAFDAMAEELEERERRLVQGERMAAIGQLAAGVAHEINNPIQVIRGYLKTMTPESSREVMDEELHIIDEEAAACQRIAEDLLTYSHSPKLKRDDVAIESLLQETSQRFRETPEGSEHEILTKADPARVSIDKARLRQVLLNLLMNSAQASEAHQPIEVVGKTCGAGDYSISVSDRGPGMSSEDKARVFEPFFTKRAGGSGLGLAVSQALVHSHGGTITIDDRAGGGTVMRIVLPGRVTPRKES